MNWKLIFSLSLFGAVMGGLSLYGYTQGTEWILWIVSGLFIIFLIAKYAGKRTFMHGLWVGVLEGIFKSFIAFLWWDSYISHNNMQAFDGPSQIAPKFFTLLIGIVTGSVYGVILGLLSGLFRKIFIKRTTQ